MIDNYLRDHLTDEEALKIAKEELERALYLSECSRSAGIRAINEEKSEWLSVLICNTEKYIRKEDERKWKVYLDRLITGHTNKT